MCSILILLSVLFNYLIFILTLYTDQKRHLNTMSTDDQVSPKKIKLDEEDLQEINPDDSSAKTPTPNTFHPLHLLSVWQEPGTTAKRLAVAILLPSGVGAGDFTVRVIEDGDVLEISVDWPKPLVEISFMHKKWLLMDDSRFTDFHPKYLGFEVSLRGLRENINDKVTSTARIGLPFSVQSHIDSKHNLAYKDNNSRLVYVDLKAADESYALLNDISEFEFVWLYECVF